MSAATDARPDLTALLATEPETVTRILLAEIGHGSD
jgi:hypothetical protein